MKRSQAAAVLGVLAVLVGAGYLGWPAAEQRQPPPAGAAASEGAQRAGVAKAVAADRAREPSPATEAKPGPQGLLAPEVGSSSLAGTQPDGDWGVDARGRLRPSRALRQRFDYYLSLVGEAPFASIEALVRQAAQNDLKEPALGEVLALWSRYVQLQRYSWKVAVDPKDALSLGAALGERQLIRRQLLGAEVAYAFYAEDEAQLHQLHQQLISAAPQPVSQGQASEPATHPQAAEREAAVQAQWQQWEERLAAARQALQKIQQAPELSSIQRRQAVDQYLTSQFLGMELVRARALLGTD